VNTLESSAATNLQQSGDYDLIVSRQSMPIPTVSFFCKFFVTEYGANKWQMPGEEYDQLFYSMMSAADPVEKTKFAEQLQDMLMLEIHQFYPIDCGDEIYAMTKDLQGVKIQDTHSIFSLAPSLRDLYFVK
jgi:hypothetical protein